MTNDKDSAMPDILERLQDEADLCRNDGADDIAQTLDDAINEIEALRQPTQSDALVAALVEASEGLKQDLLNRAEWDDDAKTVCAGAGAWLRFTTALAALQEKSK